MADDGEPHRDLVVIGASAGGLEVLRRLVAGLPADFPAALCIVMHLAPQSPSALPAILQRAGPLPCRAAEDGDALRHGEILVAPPDRHLEVEDGMVRLTLGPRENGHRPAVDPLFRSAARARGWRVIGVIVSGTRDDGTAGLAMVKASGGAAVVQDPEEALYPGMPASALAHVAVDAVVPSGSLATTLVSMVGERQPPSGSDASADPPEKGTGGEKVTTVCPECGGVLSERLEGGMIHWQCRVGHRYSPDTLAHAQAEDVEASLWAAIRALEDREALLNRMADHAQSGGQSRSAKSFRQRAGAAGEHAQAVRNALGQAAATTLRAVERGAAQEPAEEESAA